MRSCLTTPMFMRKTYLWRKGGSKAPNRLCQFTPELSSDYHQYRIWNVPECKAKYKGYLIKDKATGESAYSPPTEDADPCAQEG